MKETTRPVRRRGRLRSLLADLFRSPSPDLGVPRLRDYPTRSSGRR